MATIIKLNCVNQEITFAENPLVASGGYNEDKLQINFCELWNGYAKICVFYQNPNKHYFAMMEEDDTCVIPYEALQSDGILYLGVFGCNTEGKTRTSQIVKYVVEKGAININLQPEEPTPDIYEQLLSKYQLILETSQKTYQDEQTFESNITQRQNTFEQNITNQVNTFETDITNQQNNFESNMQSQMDNYKVEVPRIAEQYAEQKAQEVVNTKVDKADIVDNLTSTDTDKPLSANQGKVIDDKIKQIKKDVNNVNTRIDNLDILNMTYPIGSVYFSVNDTNPSTLFGGEWELIGTKLAVRENVVGNGYAEALTDGSNLGVRRSKAWYDELGYPGGVGRTLGSVSGGGDFSSYTVGGLPTKAQLGSNPQYSGLIVDTETIYSWKRTA